MSAWGSPPQKKTKMEIDARDVRFLLENGAETKNHIQNKYTVHIYVDEASSRIQISGKRQEEAKNHILNLMARRRARNTTGGTSVTVPSLKCPPVAMAASHSDNEPSLLSGVEEEPIDWQKAARDSETHGMANLIEIKKDLYRPHPSMANMTRRQADELRHRNNTKVEGGVVVVPNPVEHFEHCFDSAPLDKLREQGFQNPTPIQAQAWPILLSGQDLCAVAPRGTGKTLAYLLPALVHASRQSTVARPCPAIVLILAPSLEDVDATEVEVKKYCNAYAGDIQPISVFDTDDVDQIQFNANEKILIATPTVLADSKTIDITSISFVIIDNANEMFNKGSLSIKIKLVLGKIRSDCQKVLIGNEWTNDFEFFKEYNMKQAFNLRVGVGKHQQQQQQQPQQQQQQQPQQQQQQQPQHQPAGAAAVMVTQPLHKPIKAAARFAEKLATGSISYAEGKTPETTRKESDEMFIQTVLLRSKPVSKVKILPKNHLAYLLESFREPADLLEKLSLVELQILNRIKHRLPTMDASFVGNMANALSIIYNSNEKSEWEKEIEQNIECMVEHQIIPLFAYDCFEDWTIEVLKTCPPIANNKLFQKTILNIWDKQPPGGGGGGASATLTSLMRPPSGGQKSKSKKGSNFHTNAAIKLVEEVFYARTKVPPNTLSVGHIEALMNKAGNPQEFTVHLGSVQNAELAFFRRLTERIPLMQTDYVRIIVKAINWILSSELKDNWINNIRCNMDLFVTYQIVRLFAANQLDDATLQCLKECAVINGNKIFQKVILRKPLEGEASATLPSLQRSPSDVQQQHHLFDDIDENAFIANIVFIYSSRFANGQMSMEAWRQTIDCLLLNKTEQTKKRFIETMKSVNEYDEAKHWAVKLKLQYSEAEQQPHQIMSVAPPMARAHPPEYERNVPNVRKKQTPISKRSGINEYATGKYYGSTDYERIMVETDNQFEEMLKDVNKQLYVGFDTESSIRDRTVALLQLATAQNVYLVRIHRTYKDRFTKQRWDALTKVLNNEKILKIGFDIIGDINAVKQALPETVLKITGYFDLKLFWEEKLEQYYPDFKFPYQDDGEPLTPSLTNLVFLSFGKPLLKDATRSEWAKSKYSEDQLRYAALDAWCTREIFKMLRTNIGHEEFDAMDVFYQVIEMAGEIAVNELPSTCKRTARKTTRNNAKCLALLLRACTPLFAHE